MMTHIIVMTHIIRLQLRLPVAAILLLSSK